MLACYRHRPDAILPTRATEYSVGLDLYSPASYLSRPGERIKIDTGVGITPPPGTYIRIAPRSGLAHLYGLDVLGGVIDRDFVDSVQVLLINHGTNEVKIPAGAKIAQAIVERAIMLEPQWVVPPAMAARRGGFGSSDAHAHPDLKNEHHVGRMPPTPVCSTELGVSPSSQSVFADAEEEIEGAMQRLQFPADVANESTT